MSQLNVTSLKHESASGDNITLSSNGKVGIGTSLPPQKFVVSNAGADNIVMCENSSASIQMFMQATASTGTVGTLTNQAVGFLTNNTERMRIDSAGRVTTPYQPAFNAYISSGTNISNSWVEIVYNNICYNNGSHYNTSNGRFTAPVSGYYFFSYALTFTSADGDGTIGVFINGYYDGTSSVSQLSQPSSGSPYHGRSGSGLMYLNAGDYASVWNYNTDTRTTRSSNPRGGFIAGYLVG